MADERRDPPTNAEPDGGPEGDTNRDPRTDQGRPGGDQPYADRPPGRGPYQSKPGGPSRGGRQYGDRTPGKRPYGGKPSGGRSYGGNKPYGSGQGGGPQGSRGYGDGPQKPHGNRPPRPYGDRPPKPYGDRPPRPYGDRSSSPGGDRPRDDRPGGDRPPQQGRRVDFSQRDRPSGPRPPRGPWDRDRGPRRPSEGGRPDRYAPPRPPLGLARAEVLGEEEEIVAGRRPVEEAFAARREAKRLLVVPERRAALDQLVLHATTLRIPVVEVEGGTITAISGFDGHQGVALVVAPRRWATLDEVLALAKSRHEPPFLLALDHLEDPQNVGTLLRSAEACGVHGVIFPTRGAAPISPAAIKTSAGAVEHLLLVPLPDLAGGLVDLHARGVRVIGADGDASMTVREADLRGPIVIVTGSEGRGLNAKVRRRVDLMARIPMRGQVASLNASVAGSVFLFEAAAQRDLPEADRVSRQLASADQVHVVDYDSAEAAAGPDVPPVDDTAGHPAVPVDPALGAQASALAELDDLLPEVPPPSDDESR